MRPRDVRESLPEMVRRLRLGYLLPHSVLSAVAHGISTGWEFTAALPSSLKRSYWVAVAASMVLLTFECLTLLLLGLAPTAARAFALGTLWTSLFGPILYSQISLVRGLHDNGLFPTFGLPNSLTLVRCLHLPVVVVCASEMSVGSNLAWPALVIYLVVSVSDTFDGILARRLNLMSHFGRIYDPVTDLFYCVATGLALNSAGLVPGWFVIAALARFFLPLLGGAYVFAFKTSWSIGPTPSGRASVFLYHSFLGSVFLHTALQLTFTSYLSIILLWFASASIAFHLLVIIITGIRVCSRNSGDTTEMTSDSEQTKTRE